MKVKNLILLFAAITVSLPISGIAAEKKAATESQKLKHEASHAQTAAQTEKSQAIVSLKGMKCSFCAQGLPKAFKAQPEVESIKITMEPQQVAVNFKEGKTLSDEKITEIIKDAGINIEKIERK